jgi:hypothetical protein
MAISPAGQLRQIAAVVRQSRSHVVIPPRPVCLRSGVSTLMVFGTKRYSPTKIMRSMALKAALRLVASLDLDVKLMTKGQGLSFQRDPRSEQ